MGSDPVRQVAGSPCRVRVMASSYVRVPDRSCVVMEGQCTAPFYLHTIVLLLVFSSVCVLATCIDDYHGHSTDRCAANVDGEAGPSAVVYEEHARAVESGQWQHGNDTR